ncbi:MAG: hypothetical protein LDL11_01300 [Desulfarculus sp.]|nr:hypothetical protein [Desulfarculus sp.]
MPEVPEGIYLEIKQSTVGTGNTASRVTFRNFYAVRVVGEMADLHLLDDRLGLTGIKETVALANFPSQLSHQPKLDPFFAKLLPSLGPAQPPQTRASAPPPAARPASAPPQERSVAAVPQERAAAQPPQTRKPAPPPAEKKESGWWEMTSRGADLLKK